MPPLPFCPGGRNGQGERGVVAASSKPAQQSVSGTWPLRPPRKAEKGGLPQRGTAELPGQIQHKELGRLFSASSLVLCQEEAQGRDERLAPKPPLLRPCG